MSYPIDLEEQPTQRLWEELRRRAEQQAQGKCHYCHQSQDANPCKHSEHSPASGHDLLNWIGSAWLQPGNLPSSIIDIEALASPCSRREDHGEHIGKLLVGPCSDLRQALALCEPDPITGCRIALSVPQGDVVAVLLPTGLILVRWSPAVTGHGGSILGTGHWIASEAMMSRSWRPG